VIALIIVVADDDVEIAIEKRRKISRLPVAPLFVARSHR